MPHHIFNPANRARLDSPERHKTLPPAQTLIKLGLSEGDRFIDIGCGTGFFSIPALEIVKSSGAVFALDISDEMLADLWEKAKKLAPAPENLHILRSDPYRLPVPDASGNAALLCNVLHEIEDKPRLLREIRRTLSPGGVLWIIEWRKEKTDGGPSLEMRLDSTELLPLLSGAGFTPHSSEILNTSLYSVRAIRKED